jgi:3-phosphoshikimate 1-carboxyvinyltransferase
MRVTFRKGRAEGSVYAPTSKSMAHRLLICAGLSEGKSVIHGVSECEDVLATIDCLRAFGIECVRDGDTVTVIGGKDLVKHAPTESLCCRESGSTLRFLLPVALLSGNDTVLCGASGLMQRPMTVYEEICAERGLKYEKRDGCITVKGPLSAGEYKVVGNISSQFISGLIFALTLADGDSIISITPPIESRSYINLTVSALREFGVTVTWSDERTLYIKGNQKYCACETTVEGDYSNAAFLDALNLLDGSVEVLGLNDGSLQGDKVYKGMYRMLCKGTPTIHIGDCPDLGPVLFALSAVKNGAVFSGTRRLKIKESDRSGAMAEELKKFGTSVTVYDDSVVVYPADFHAPSEPLCGHNDHRIVMALSVLLTLTGGCIEGAEAVKKSFPDFFECLSSLGIDIETEEAL